MALRPVASDGVYERGGPLGKFCACSARTPLDRCPLDRELAASAITHSSGGVADELPTTTLPLLAASLAFRRVAGDPPALDAGGSHPSPASCRPEGGAGRLTDADRDDAGRRPDGLALSAGETELSCIAKLCRSGDCIFTCLGAFVCCASWAF